jgi:pSer/pThr/pTyr-binding forkhead associated (FHA) protein
MNTWQADNNDTEPAMSSDERQSLREAAKALKLETQEVQVESEVRVSAGNALLQNHTTVIFALLDSEMVLSVHVVGRMVIGRKDWETEENADVDLTPYDGWERGVSRRHAALYRNSQVVTLVDLKSTNGTFINGTRLIPYQPRLLREGDEVRFGGLRFLISFDL